VDTVYVSLWKYFNSGVGAVLAGSKVLLDGMYHTRRMFGGNLWNGWSAALVARHFMEGFGDRLAAAVRKSEEFYTALARERGVAIERIPNGTNLARVAVDHPDLAAVRRRAGEQGFSLPTPRNGRFTLAVNETWNRASATELLDRFRRALG